MANDEDAGMPNHPQLEYNECESKWRVRRKMNVESKVATHDRILLFSFDTLDTDKYGNLALRK